MSVYLIQAFFQNIIDIGSHVINEMKQKLSLVLLKMFEQTFLYQRVMYFLLQFGSGMSDCY